jgi:hypothetical protein
VRPMTATTKLPIAMPAIAPGDDIPFGVVANVGDEVDRVLPDCAKDCVNGTTEVVIVAEPAAGP